MIKGLQKKRPDVVAVTSVFFYIMGFSAILACFVFLFMLPTGLSLLEIEVNMTMLTIIGISCAIWGILDLIAGYGLWRIRIYGGAFALGSVILQFIVGIIENFVVLGMGVWDMIISAGLFVLVLISWKYLK